MLQLLGWRGQAGSMDVIQWFSDDLMVFRPPGCAANELCDVFCGDPPFVQSDDENASAFQPRKLGC